MFSQCRPWLFALILALSMTPSITRGQLPDPIAERIPLGDTIVTLTPVATGLTAPIWAASAPGDQVVGRLFIADQAGTIWSVDSASTAPILFFDVKAQVAPMLALDQRFDLLGVIFHPDYAINGLFYTYTLEPATEPAHFPAPMGVATTHQTVLREWPVISPTMADTTVNVAGARVLLRIAQPQLNNNGGGMGFDIDEFLYIGIGDGGGIDDRDGEFFDDTDDGIDNPTVVTGHGTGNAQNLGTVLGSILRIDPLGTSLLATNVGQYGIPNDNPTLFGLAPVGGQEGCRDGSCDEIFAHGFRNPAQLSFDPRGLLYVGDVGQSRGSDQNIEEINLVFSGDNSGHNLSNHYGWQRKAGTFFLNTDGIVDGVETPGILISDARGTPPALIDPVAQYDHDEGVLVRGGFVYRSEGTVESLHNRYIFGTSSRTTEACAGRLFYTEFIQFDTETIRFLVLSNQLVTPISELLSRDLGDRCILGFGQDAGGEMYVLANNGDDNSGVVLRIGQQ